MSADYAKCGGCLSLRPIGASGLIGWHERWDDTAGRYVPCSGVGYPPVWFASVGMIRADTVPVGEVL